MKPDTSLRVLASSIDMLARQLLDLPPELRVRVGGPGPKALRNWHKRVVALRDELGDPAAPEQGELPEPAPEAPGSEAT